MSQEVYLNRESVKKHDVSLSSVVYTIKGILKLRGALVESLELKNILSCCK